LKAALSFELSHCDDRQVHETYIKILNNIDNDLATAVARNVGDFVPDKEAARPKQDIKSPALSQLYYAPKTPTIESRRIAILVAEGFNKVEVEAVREMLRKQKATTWIIGPQRKSIDRVPVAHHFEGQRSTLFDALYIPSGEKQYAKALMENGRAVHWVREAFGHCKAIGAIGEGKLFIYIVKCHNTYNDSQFLKGVNVVLHALGPEIPEINLNLQEGSDDVKESHGVVTIQKYDAAVDVLKISGDAKGFVSQFAYQISLHRRYDREMKKLTNKVAY